MRTRWCSVCAKHNYLSMNFLLLLTRHACVGRILCIVPLTGVWSWAADWVQGQLVFSISPRIRDNNRSTVVSPGVGRHWRCLGSGTNCQRLTEGELGQWFGWQILQLHHGCDWSHNADPDCDCNLNCKAHRWYRQPLNERSVGNTRHCGPSRTGNQVEVSGQLRKMLPTDSLAVLCSTRVSRDNPEGVAHPLWLASFKLMLKKVLILEFLGNCLHRRA